MMTRAICGSPAAARRSTPGAMRWRWTPRAARWRWISMASRGSCMRRWTSGLMNTLCRATQSLDGSVDDVDASIVGAHWRQSGVGWGDGDFNRDGRVDDRDAAILAAYWGQTFVQESPGVEGQSAGGRATTPVGRMIGPSRARLDAGPARRIEPLPGRRLPSTENRPLTRPRLRAARRASWPAGRVGSSGRSEASPGRRRRRDGSRTRRRGSDGRCPTGG